MILLLPLLIIVLCIVIFLAARTAAVRNFGNFLKNRTRQWIVIAYISILVIFTVGMYLYADFHGIVKTKVSTEDNQKALEEYNRNIYEYALTGKQESINRKYLMDYKKLEFSERQLDLHQQNMSLSVVAEEKKDNDGIVECYAYSLPAFIDEMDVTGRTQRLKFAIKGKDLGISSSSFKEISPNSFVSSPVNVYYFNSEFPLTQVNKDFYYETHKLFFYPRQLVYIKLPKGVCINSGKEWVQFIKRDLD